VVQALTGARQEWRAKHPASSLQLLEGPTGVIRDWLADGHVQFGVVETPPDYGSRLPLGSPEPLGVLAAAGSGLAQAEGVRAQDLTQIPLVLPSSVFGLRELIDSELTGEGKLSPVMEVNSLATTLALVAQGDVATILPRAALPEGALEAGLVFIPILGPQIGRRLYATFSNDRELAPHERDLIAILRQKLQ
jgi:DNA-binding transcriptional LysR family regulator